MKITTVDNPRHSNCKGAKPYRVRPVEGGYMVQSSRFQMFIDARDVVDDAPYFGVNYMAVRMSGYWVVMDRNTLADVVRWRKKTDAVQSVIKWDKSNNGTG